MKSGLLAASVGAFFAISPWLACPAMADGNPDQRPLISGVTTYPWTYMGYQVTPLASYSIEARVLHLKKYADGRNAEVCPIDFAVGWGRMSDPAVYGKLIIGQDGRFFTWRTYSTPPIPSQEINTSSANMHLVPATTKLWCDLLTVREGDMVQLDGFLIQITGDDGWHWTSSLRRDDVGAGACELMWVNSLKITDRLDHSP